MRVQMDWLQWSKTTVLLKNVVWLFFAAFHRVIETQAPFRLKIGGGIE